MAPACMVSAEEELTVATFAVREVSEGSETRWEDGLLRIDLDAVETMGSGVPGVRRMRAEMVYPGQPVRLVNVLDAVDPSGQEGRAGDDVPRAAR